jgi:hypothetical protein
MYVCVCVCVYVSRTDLVYAEYLFIYLFIYLLIFENCREILFQFHAK